MRVKEIRLEVCAMAELMRDTKRTNDWVKSILSALNFRRSRVLITDYYKGVERTEKSGRQLAVWTNEKYEEKRKDEVEMRA